MHKLTKKRRMADWITLNVGGTKFTTTIATLTSDPDSMLAKMFQHEGAIQPAAQDSDGAYLIDANPDYFKPILNFLRRGELVIDPGVSRKGVMSEAKYFGIHSLVSLLNKGTAVGENEETPKKCVVGSKVRITTADGAIIEDIVKEVNEESWYLRVGARQVKVNVDQIQTLEVLDKSVHSYLNNKFICKSSKGEIYV